jgi:hypothetical protein
MLVIDIALPPPGKPSRTHRQKLPGASFNAPAAFL